MKKAFYGGAHVMCEMQYILGDKNISEDAALGIIGGIHDEVNDFVSIMTKNG